MPPPSFPLSLSLSTSTSRSESVVISFLPTIFRRRVTFPLLPLRVQPFLIPVYNTSGVSSLSLAALRVLYLSSRLNLSGLVWLIFSPFFLSFFILYSFSYCLFIYRTLFIGLLSSFCDSYSIHTLFLFTKLLLYTSMCHVQLFFRCKQKKNLVSNSIESFYVVFVRDTCKIYCFNWMPIMHRIGFLFCK